MRVTKIEILKVDAKKWPSLRIKAYKGSNFAPELLFDSGSNLTSKMEFSCDFLVHGNFKVQADQPGMWKPKKLFEFWHNTLFVSQDTPVIDFGKDELDIKRKVLKTLDSSMTLRLTFGAATAQDISFLSQAGAKKNFSVGDVHNSI